MEGTVNCNVLQFMMFGILRGTGQRLAGEDRMVSILPCNVSDHFKNQTQYKHKACLTINIMHVNAVINMSMGEFPERSANKDCKPGNHACKVGNHVEKYEQKHMFL